MPPMKFGKHFKSETYLQKFCLIAFCLSAVVQGSLSMLWTKPWGKLGKYYRVLLRYRVQSTRRQWWGGLHLFCFLQCRKSEGARWQYWGLSHVFSHVSGSLLPRLWRQSSAWPGSLLVEPSAAWGRTKMSHYNADADADQEVRRMTMIMRRRTRVMLMRRITMLMLTRRPGGWQWWRRCWSWTFQRALLLSRLSVCEDQSRCQLLVLIKENKRSTRRSGRMLEVVIHKAS